jgi:hypothetical protein
VLKAHIRVDEDTDVAAELLKINNLAQKHRLDPAKTTVLMRNVEDVISSLKKQGAETAAFGIKLAVMKSVSSEDYDIVVELHPRKASSRSNGLLGWLFRR